VFSIRLNRLGDTPTFNIYHCAACGRMMWIPLAAE
jgi:hypothetical protein